MRRFFTVLRKIAPFALLIVAFAVTALYPVGARGAPSKPHRIVHVWNIDTFEGGRGSRTGFLKQVAVLTERSYKGVYYHVTSYTKEGALEAQKNGSYPDILSFGIGFSGWEDRCVPLDASFAGERRALPWCRGKYVLFSLDEDFSEAGPTAISVGGNNLSCVAARYAQIDGEEVDAQSAYIGFLSGKYRYLLGTQRDVCRFDSRGTTVYERELSGYCDLYQYIAVLSESAYADCRNFLNVLFSGEVQRSLGVIGMQPAAGAQGATPGAFASDETLCELARLARENALLKNLENFLKSV